MSILLNITDLHWQAANKAILKNISFKVNKGEVIGIIGPNGAGKTSLLRCITHQQKSHNHSVISGSIHLKNKNISHYSVKQLAQYFAIVAQKFEPVFSLTVFEVVKMGLLPHKNIFSLDNDHDIAQIKLALNKVGLAPLINESFNQLSGGEQQRVLIARALLQQGEILILDEPTNHLDVYYQHQVLRLVKNLNVTVIMTVHDLNLASQYCQRLLLLNQGELVCDGTPEVVLTSERLSKVFRVNCIQAQDPITNTPHVYFSLNDSNTGEYGE